MVKDDMAAFTAALPLAHEPGTVFNYSSGTTNILSRIVADVVGYGDDYRDYLDAATLRAPWHDERRSDLRRRAASSSRRATCTRRALDFAKFGLLYLRGGEWDGRQLDLTRVGRDRAGAA